MMHTEENKLQIKEGDATKDIIAKKIGELCLVFDEVDSSVYISRDIKDLPMSVLAKLFSPFSENVYLTIYNTCKIILPGTKLF